MKTLLTISILFFGALVIVYTLARIYFRFQFHQQVKLLFSQSKNISNQSFQYSQLVDLPDPVKRYFKYVLKEGQAFISYARFTHDGQFKTGLTKNWVTIKGEQYATTETPGFIWKGVTSLFTARDFFIAGKGQLVVSLFSIFNIVNGKGPQYDQGELLRWLGESVLYPTNLLPNDRLQWTAIDGQTAKLTFVFHELSLFFIVTFNILGEITQLETKRYMDKNLQTWIIKLSGYKEINGVRVATSFDVLWRLKDVDFTYAKFHIKKIEYNAPFRYY